MTGFEAPASTITGNVPSLESLLKPGSRILYENVFSTRRIGRILDFMLYESRSFLEAHPDPGLAEFRIRHAIEIGVFNAWSNYRKGEKSRCVELELGWDDERLVLSVAFYVDSGVAGFVPGAGEPSAGAGERIRKMLERVQELADGLLVRHEPQSGRMQILVFVAAREGGPVAGAVQFVEIGPDSTASEEVAADPASAPIPLADGNAAGFERDGVTQETVSSRTVVKGDATELKTDDVIRIKGDGTEARQKDLLLVKGGGQDAVGGADAAHSIQVLLDAVKAVIVPLCVGASDSQKDESLAIIETKVREHVGQSLRHMLDQKTKNHKDQLQRLSARIKELETEVELPSEGLKAREAVQQYESSFEKGDIAGDEKAKEWCKGLLEAVTKERAALNHRAREIEANLKKREHEFKSKDAAMREELRLKDESLRQKDVALQKNKEVLNNAFQMLERARSAAAPNPKDGDLGLKLAAAEKFASVSKEQADRMQKRADDLQKRWQEEFSARSQLQAEKSKVQMLYDDLLGKLTDDGDAKKLISSEEASRLIEERDRSLKVIEDLKKQMKELQSKLAAALTSGKTPPGIGGDLKKNGASAMGDAELRHKFDQANKLNSAMKEELERTKKRFDDLKQSETKLRVEVAKLQADLKAAGKAPQAEKAPLKTPARLGGSISKK